LLRRAGAQVCVYTRNRAPVRWSRHIDRLYAAPAGVDFVAGFKSHLASHRYDWVIVGDEPTLYAIVDFTRTDCDGPSWTDGWFPIPGGAERFEALVTKAGFVDATRAAGVPIPDSRVCTDLDAARTAAADMGYPVMLKTSVGSAGDGVAKARDQRELDAVFARFAARPPLVVQKFLPGQLGLTEMLFDHGRPICWWPTFKPLVYPEPFGPSCVRVLLDQAGIDRMEPIVHKIGAMTGFHGLCAIDWIVDEAGDFRVIEFNPRPTPGAHLAKLAGEDVSLAVADMLAGKCLPQRPRQTKYTHRPVYMFPQYLKRAMREHPASLRHFLPFAGLHDFPWAEPWLLLKELVPTPYTIRRRLRRMLTGPRRAVRRVASDRNESDLSREIAVP
jgi:hypothetical protein